MKINLQNWFQRFFRQQVFYLKRTKEDAVMYFDLLKKNNTEFQDSVFRWTSWGKSDSLKNVINALHDAQKEPSLNNIIELCRSLEIWRDRELKEFLDRGGTNGVGYRLWKEAKQFCRNNFKMNYPSVDPLWKDSYPGTEIEDSNGTKIYVPAPKQSDEICHQFTYRWLVASGKIACRDPYKLDLPDAGQAQAAIFPGNIEECSPVRTGGMMQTTRGDIIGFYNIYESHPLIEVAGKKRPSPDAVRAVMFQHSMVARNNTVWVGSNNNTCFGVSGDRQDVKLNDSLWNGQENAFKRGNLLVVYRRVPVAA